jgi:hypothetical protein
VTAVKTHLHDGRRIAKVPLSWPRRVKCVDKCTNYPLNAWTRLLLWLSVIGEILPSWLRRLLPPRGSSFGLYFCLIAGLIPRLFLFIKHWKPQTPGGIVWYGVSTGVFVGSCFLILFYLFIPRPEALERAYARQVRRKSPIAHLLYLLFSTLERLPVIHTLSNSWVLPLLGEPLISNLEDAADCVESIPRILLLRDPTLAFWSKAAYRQRANGIRALRKWILVPKVDTPKFLEQELRRIIQKVAEGDLDGLPAADRDTLLVLPWWKIALRILHGLAIIAIPPLVLFALNDWPPPGWENSIFKEYSVPIALLWMLISVLSILDPRFADKLSLIKGVQDLFTFKSKEKD